MQDRRGGRSVEGGWWPHCLPAAYISKAASPLCEDRQSLASRNEEELVLAHRRLRAQRHSPPTPAAARPAQAAVPASRLPRRAVCLLGCGPRSQEALPHWLWGTSGNRSCPSVGAKGFREPLGRESHHGLRGPRQHPERAGQPRGWSSAGSLWPRRVVSVHSGAWPVPTACTRAPLSDMHPGGGSCGPTRTLQGCHALESCDTCKCHQMALFHSLQRATCVGMTEFSR